MFYWDFALRLQLVLLRRVAAAAKAGLSIIKKNRGEMYRRGLCM